ncbi:hypothetical protein A5784_30775 [Mycobacterium sp. 852013-50091_SCH5140682]|nr:hypothetical protein A5784_30775 [Mycobacterium sp. 852013-50091_SCH5140682]
MVDTYTWFGGARGEYRIERIGQEWILNGRGHDGVSMLALPEGRAFASLEDAQDYAERLDRVKAVEAQASGC